MTGRTAQGVVQACCLAGVGLERCPAGVQVAGRSKQGGQWWGVRQWGARRRVDPAGVEVETVSKRRHCRSGGGR